MPLLAAVFFIVHGYSGDAEKWSLEVPEPLRKAFEYRMKPRTGYIKFERAYQGGANSPKMTITTEARFAGRNVLLDEDTAGGIIMVPPNAVEKTKADQGTPHFRRAQVVDYEQNRLFARNAGQDHARLEKIATIQPFDVRSMGLTWGIRRDQSPTGIMSDLKKIDDSKFRTIEAKGILTITAKYDTQPGWETVWMIDPSKDYSIVRVDHTYTFPDKSRSSSCICISELEKVDGYWWPRRIESRCDESGFRETIEIISMEFDRATHPEKINLDTLNLPVGAKIQEQAGSAEDPYFKEYQYIGNDQLVYVRDLRLNFGRRGPPEDLNSVRKRATIRPDGTWVVESPEIVPKLVPPPKIGVPGNPDEWEKFVRLWIKRRDNTDEYVKVKRPLEEKQKNAAMAILQESREPAWNLVNRRKRELEVLYSRLKEKEAAQQGKQADMESQAAIDSLKVRIEDLEASDPEVEAIFARLKSRLNDLLTAQQRDSSNFVGNQAKPRASTSRPA